MSKNISRRNFLGTCGMMSSLPIVSTILQMQMTNSVLAQSQFSDYKAIVCVFLAGGNDSHNMLIPNENDEYSHYAEARRHVAIGRDSILPIVDRNNSNKKYGVSPHMPEIAELYNDRDLGFVANVGSLIRPMTTSDFQNDVNRPRGLFSHFEQEAAWQTSIADRLTSHGWMGRIQDILLDRSSFNPAVSLNISPSGSSRMQTGVSSSPFSIGTSLDGYSGKLADSVNATLETKYNHLLSDQYAHDRKRLIEQSEVYADVVNNVDLNTQFSGRLGDSLRQVAEAIARRNELGHTRQTFFVRMNGYDTHAGLLESHSDNYPGVSQALKAFNEAMKELGVHNQVLTYTGSDFGRSMSPNTSGTDHGWGGNQMVMGGMVNGGRIFGNYPTDLRLGSATDIGRGRQLPTTSCDQFHAEMAEWFGIQNRGDMEIVLPNIRNFWARNANSTLNMFV